MAHTLFFREVTAANWSEFEQLFESKGGPKSCWCMVWRTCTEEAKHTDGRRRKAAMKQRVRCNTPVGLLAYSDQEPVAWCSIAPRSTYRRLVSDGTPDQGVWSIVCFFVLLRLRRAGIARRLIAAAVEHARAVRVCYRGDDVNLMDRFSQRSPAIAPRIPSHSKPHVLRSSYP